MYYIILYHIILYYTIFVISMSISFHFGSCYMIFYYIILYILCYTVIPLYVMSHYTISFYLISHCFSLYYIYICLFLNLILYDSIFFNIIFIYIVLFTSRGHFVSSEPVFFMYFLVLVVGGIGGETMSSGFGRLVWVDWSGQEWPYYTALGLWVAKRGKTFGKIAGALGRSGWRFDPLVFGVKLFWCKGCLV